MSRDLEKFKHWNTANTKGSTDGRILGLQPRDKAAMLVARKIYMKKEFSSQRRDTSRANQQLAETDRNTVEPIVHTWEQKKVAVVERWPLWAGRGVI